eukprot:915194-Pelagomonas_calceolata.AAC.8
MTLVACIRKIRVGQLFKRKEKVLPVLVSDKYHYGICSRSLPTVHLVARRLFLPERREDVSDLEAFWAGCRKHSTTPGRKDGDPSHPRAVRPAAAPTENAERGLRPLSTTARGRHHWSHPRAAAARRISDQRRKDRSAAAAAAVSSAGRGAAGVHRGGAEGMSFPGRCFCACQGAHTHAYSQGFGAGSTQGLQVSPQACHGAPGPSTQV